jgi:hypothetical protein
VQVLCAAANNAVTLWSRPVSNQSPRRANALNGPTPKEDEGPRVATTYNALQGGVGDTNYRRPVECRAVGVERRPVHRGIALSAGPGSVSAAVLKAVDVSNEDLVRPEGVSVGASARWVHDPLPGRGPYEVAQHDFKHMCGCLRLSTKAATSWASPTATTARCSPKTR